MFEIGFCVDIGAGKMYKTICLFWARVCSVMIFPNNSGTLFFGCFL